MGLFDILTKKARERERERAEEQARIEEDHRINALIWNLVSDKKWDDAIEAVDRYYKSEEAKRVVLRAITSKKKELEDRERREKYEYKVIRLAGASFRNEDGTSRQTYLRKIRFRDPPFNETLNVSITEDEYEGEPALPVLVNGCKVGFVPRKQVGELLNAWDRIDAITAFDVIGGGLDDNGERMHYGADVYIRLFRNKTP